MCKGIRDLDWRNVGRYEKGITECDKERCEYEPDGKMKKCR